MNLSQEERDAIEDLRGVVDFVKEPIHEAVIGALEPKHCITLLALLDRLLAQPVRAAQAGWQLVPVELADAMFPILRNFRSGQYSMHAGLTIADGDIREAWKDLLAAAPSAEPLMADEDLILSQLKRIGELDAEVQRLEGLVYVPGLWRCAKCKLSVHSQTLNIAHGTINANNEPQPCINGCGPMWRVTERDAGNELAERMNDVRNATLEQLKRIVQGYQRQPKATVVHFLGKVEADVREADLAPKRAAAAEIIKLIDALMGPK